MNSVRSHISKPPGTLGRILATATMLTCTIIQTVQAQTTPQDRDFLTGVAFQQRLQGPVTSQWKLPLRDLVYSLESNFQICIFLDRRIDPQQTISLQVENTSLEQTLRRLALTAKADLCFIRDVVYLGPTPTCHLLATVAEIHAQNLRATAATGSRAVLTKPVSLQWQRLAQPRTILTQEATRAQLAFSNPEAIPYDLWNAGSLAQLPFAHRTTILLAGFNKTFQFIDDQTMLVIEFPSQASLQKIIQRKISPANLAKVKTQFPKLELQVRPEGISVQGRWEDIAEFEKLLAGGKSTITKPATTGMQVYTLTVENQSTQAILQAVAQQSDLKIQATAAAKARWTKLISIEAKQLTLEQLLTQIVAPAMLAYEIKDSILTVDIANQ